MDRSGVEAVLGALNAAEVRYLVVGGLAVVAHGYVRFTADLDLLLDLDERNLRCALKALASLGFRPRAPVPMERFADRTTRETWIRDKGLRVFSVYSDLHPATEVDLFANDPLGFDRAYREAVRMEVAPRVVATFVSLADLIRLKQLAGRPRDVDDIERLRSLHGENADD